MADLAVWGFEVGTTLRSVSHTRVCGVDVAQDVVRACCLALI